MASSSDVRAGFTDAQPLLQHDDGDVREPSIGTSLCECWGMYGDAIRIGVYGALVALPYVLVRPAMIITKRNYFGSDQHAALFTGFVDATVAVINLFAVNVMTAAMGSYGRTPLLCIRAVLLAIAAVLAALWPRNPWPFMVAFGAANVFNATPVIAAMISDLYPKALRPRVLGIQFAVQMSLFVLGALPSLLPLGDTFYFAVAAAACVAGLVFVKVCLRETLRGDQRAAMTFECRNPLAGVAVVASSEECIIAVALASLATMAAVGTKELAAFFLNQRFGFGRHDLGLIAAEEGVLMPFSLVVLLPLLLKWFGPPAVIIIALTGLIGMNLAFALATAKWVVFAVAAPLGCGLIALFPLSIALVANAGPTTDVAARVVAMQAVADTVSAAAALAFAVLYGEVPRRLNALPFFIMAACMAVGVLLAGRLRHISSPAPAFPMSEQQCA
jgi:DHA1 family tetracycline resistance protein-like MFS transporter